MYVPVGVSLGITHGVVKLPSAVKGVDNNTICSPVSEIILILRRAESDFPIPLIVIVSPRSYSVLSICNVKLNASGMFTVIG